MSPHSFSIFFPMYNERKNVEQVLAQAGAIVPCLGFPIYEIVFVDDGSRDGCDDVILMKSLQDEHVRLVRHPRNMGYGAALRTGFTSVVNDVVFYTDCDLPADLNDIERALPLLEDHDLVVGYRIQRHETLRRAIYSRIYNLLMRFLFGVRVRDVNFSFKLVHRRVLDRIRLSAGTVFIDGQLLAEAARYGYKIAEIPVEYTPRKFGRSNFDSLKTAWNTFTELLRYWWESRVTIKEEEPLATNSV